MSIRKLLRKPYGFGIPLVATYTIAAWIFRDLLRLTIRDNPETVAAVVVGIAVLLFSYFATSQFEGRLNARRFLARTEQVTGLHSLGTVSRLRRIRSRFPDLLEWVAKPVLSTNYGENLRQDWVDSGWGSKGSRALALLLLAAVLTGIAGVRVAGWLLTIFLMPTTFLLLRSAISAIAESARKRLIEQLPHALESLASGLSAGLTFQQSVAFASHELPEPSANLMRRLDFRMNLGHPVEAAMSAITDIQADEALALAIDGIVLQRQFGGDLIAHLEEVATLLRDRLELQREVRSVTAQGRLSGWVIGALVPVSAGILLTFNPQYIKILFDTLIGQLVLVTVILLQIIGWVLISRLIRIRY